MKTAFALLLGSFVALVGCARGGGDEAPGAPAAEADITKAPCIQVGNQCIRNGMSVLPKEGSGASVSEKCFHWNRSKEVSHIDVDDKNAEFNGLFHKISESRDKKQDELTIVQLRLTLKFFGVEGDVDKMSVDQLFTEADDPVFSHWEMTGTSLKFVQINIALGDNPMDLVFKEGTLDPVAAAGDDNALFCAPELKGK
jgi:hypothetical protein